MDVVITNDDTATVRYNGATTNLPSVSTAYSTPYGSPTILTVERFFASVKSGGQYGWRVHFSFGGFVEVESGTGIFVREGEMERLCLAERSAKEVLKRSKAFSDRLHLMWKA